MAQQAQAKRKASKPSQVKTKTTRAVPYNVQRAPATASGVNQNTMVNKRTEPAGHQTIINQPCSNNNSASAQQMINQGHYAPFVQDKSIEELFNGTLNA